MVKNVQVLRALAAYMVVLEHSSGLNVSFAILPGGLGVDLFFLISGFVMVFTTTAKPVGPSEFMIHRIIRIVPLYWVLTLGVFILSAVAPALVKATRPDIGDLFKSLFFIASVKSNGLVMPTLFAGWSLNYEMFFYALFAASLVVRSAAWRTVALAVLMGTFVAAGTLVPPGHPVAAFYTSGKLLEFAYGMVLGLLYPRMALRPVPAFVGATVLGLGLAALFVLNSVVPVLPIALSPGIPDAVILTGALLLEARGHRFGGPALLLAGAASYSLYLTHIFITGVMEVVARHLHLLDSPIRFLLVVVNLVLSTAVAIACYRYFERPSGALLRGMLGRMQKSGSATSPGLGKGLAGSADQG